MPPTDELQQIPDLPTEIYISIIDQWALMWSSRSDEEWFEGLSALSRSAKFLSHLAQRHIFRAITLTTDKSEIQNYRLRSFLRILEKSPHLTDYIKCIVLRWERIFDEGLAAKIFAKFHHLEGMKLHGCIVKRGGYISWRLDLGYYLRSELCRIIASPSLIYLGLVWWEGVPLELLGTARYLTSLTLAGVYLERRENPSTRYVSNIEATPNPPRTRLKTFNMYGELEESINMLCESDINDPSAGPAFDLSGVDTVSLTWRDTDDVQTSKILANHSAPLRELSLAVLAIFDSTLSGLAELILYKSSKSLDVLQVTTYPLSADSGLMDPLYGLSEELSALSGDATKLCTVNVIIKSTGTASALSQLFEVAFPSLDQALSTGFSALTRLNITIKHQRYPQDPPKEFRDAFNGWRRHFPKISVLERITFKMSV